MSKNTIIIGAVIIILGGVAWYVLGRGESATSNAALGTYSYVCENGSEFTMTPSEDISQLTLEAGSQGMFTGSVTVAKMGDGNHFETTSGDLIVFSGAGEEVQLSVGNETTVCNPKADGGNAPWNWGDAGEGAGSVQPDAALVVTESIRGKWRSVDDTKFVREFRENDVVVDWHDNEEVSRGLWVAFTKKNAPEVPYPLEDNRVYIQMTETGSQADTMYFKVVKLTPEELELIYMDRGGTLRFKYVQ